jgi:hypothetical protein
MGSFYLTCYGQTKHAFRIWVWLTCTTVACRHGIILVLSANMGVQSASVFGQEWSWVLICCQTDWPLNDINCSAGAAAHCGEEVRRWFNVTYPWRLIRPRGPHCMASLVARSNSDGFFSEGWRLCSPCQDYIRSGGKISGSCDSGWCHDVRHVRENALRHTSAYLEMDGGRFLSSIDCTGIDLDSEIHHRRNLEYWCQVSVQARKMELHVRDHSSVQDNFRKPIDAVHDCNMVERCEDMFWRTHLPVVRVSVFKWKQGNRGW